MTAALVVAGVEAGRETFGTEFVVADGEFMV